MLSESAQLKTFKLDTSVEVNRLGFGAMRIVGPGVWGEPGDRAEALRTLRRLPELGVNFIDTADSYGPNISEQLIREALHPYQGLHVATKAGMARTGPDRWIPLGRPEYLIQQACASRQRLGVERITLWQLHRIDPQVPRDEQFDAVRQLLDDGVIAHAGLSQVSLADIQAASKVFRVATVQNRYSVAERASESVLRHCEQHGIGFIPWFPLSAGRLVQTGSPLQAVARDHGASPAQVALAWLLAHSPVMLPIPGTSKVAHLEENVAAADLRLTADEQATLSAMARP